MPSQAAPLPRAFFPSRRHVPGAWTVLFVLLVSPFLAAGAEAEQSRVRLSPAAATELERLDIAAARTIDYGAYHWATFDSETLERVAASGVPYQLMADADRVRIGDYDFDPLRDGEPRLAAGWDQPAHTSVLRLVQLEGPGRDAWLDRLSATGAELVQYYPHNTYLAKVDPLTATALTELDFVRWQGPVHPAYKLSTELAKVGVVLDPTSGLELPGTALALKVIFVKETDPRPMLDTLATFAPLEGEGRAQPDGRLHRALLTLSPTALENGALLDIAQLDQVLWIGLQSPGIALEDEMSSQIVAGNHPFGVPVTGYFAHLAGLGYDGSGVIWMVADTGVDYDHPDIGSRIVGGFSVPGTACNTPPGSDCASPGGHGTHVAGIVGGDATGGFSDVDGFLYGLGVAPEVSFFALNLFGNVVPLETYSQQAVLGGAVGSNNSWTTGEGIAHGYQDSERTYDFMVRDGDFDTPEDEPHIVVFSAGNSGPGALTLTAPKEAKNVIVTAGTQNYRSASDIDNMYVFSSRGPAVDGRYVPTIAAPGQTIASTRNDLGGSCANAIGGTNDLYAFCSGTSMAAPQTSGALAVASEWWRSRNGGDDFSPAMAKALLVVSAVAIDSTPPNPNFDDGWGRIQLTELIAPGIERAYFDQETVFDTSGEEWSFTTTVIDTAQPLKVSLAWTDAPGALGANPALVNDLDLEVETGGTTYLGNQLSAGVSIPGGVSDTLNNLENVFVTSPGATVTVTVRATAVVGDGLPDSGDATDQDFALVCHNCRAPTIFADGFESGDTSAWSSAAGL